jgi:hypothetical protein
MQQDRATPGIRGHGADDGVRNQRHALSEQPDSARSHPCTVCKFEIFHRAPGEAKSGGGVGMIDQVRGVAKVEIASCLVSRFLNIQTLYPATTALQ